MRFFPIKKLYLPALSIVAVGFILLVLISISTYRNLDRQKAIALSSLHRQGEGLTQFEFFAVAVSIILALGISRLLDGVLPSLHAARRYWVHFLWVLHKLINHIIWWWGTWSANTFEGWNLAWFVWTLAGPIVLYLQATALVSTTPQDVGETVEFAA